MNNPASQPQKKVSKHIARRSGRIFAYHLPDTWILRSQEDQNDYGIDFEVQLVDASKINRNESFQSITTDIFKIQLKGSTEFDPNKFNPEQPNTFPTCQFKLGKLKHFYSLSIPVFLVWVYVGEVQSDPYIFWVNLQCNQDIKKKINEDNEDNEDNDDKDVNIRISNIFTIKDKIIITDKFIETYHYVVTHLWFKNLIVENYKIDNYPNIVEEYKNYSGKALLIFTKKSIIHKINKDFKNLQECKNIVPQMEKYEKENLKKEWEKMAVQFLSLCKVHLGFISYYEHLYSNNDNNNSMERNYEEYLDMIKPFYLEILEKDSSNEFAELLLNVIVDDAARINCAYFDQSYNEYLDKYYSPEDAKEIGEDEKSDFIKHELQDYFTRK